MGMAAAPYALFNFAHSLRSLRRNILGLIGASPARTTLIGGGGGALTKQKAAQWIATLERLGRAAA